MNCYLFVKRLQRVIIFLFSFIGLTCIASGVAFAAQENIAARDHNITEHIWTMTDAALVLLMQIGFYFLKQGL